MRRETLTLFSVGLLLLTPPTVRSQEAAANSTSASVEAGDRQFLKNLERSETGKSPTAPTATTTIQATPVSTPAPAKAKPLSKPVEAPKEIAVTKKPHEVAKTSHHEGASKPAEVAATEPATVVTVTTITNDAAAEPEEDRRPDDDGFLHRFFAHVFHRPR